MDNITTLLLLPLMVVAFYFLLIRPQRKRAQAQQKLLAEMQPGERVLTHSGIFGTLVSVGPKQSVIEVSPGVEFTVLKQAISRVVRPEDEDDPSDELDVETDSTESDTIESGTTPFGGPAAGGTAGTAGTAGASTAAAAESAYDPYRPGEPSSLDLPDGTRTTTPDPIDQPVEQPAGQAEQSDAGIRDVTSSYFARPDSAEADAAESETPRPTKDS